MTQKNNDDERPRYMGVNPFPEATRENLLWLGHRLDQFKFSDPLPIDLVLDCAILDKLGPQAFHHALRGAIENLSFADMADRLWNLTLEIAALNAEHVAPKKSPAKKAAHRQRLRTREQIVRAIRRVTAQLANGDIEPNAAKARLYAFQTLLAAMQTTQPAPTQPETGATIQAARDPEST